MTPWSPSGYTVSRNPHRRHTAYMPLVFHSTGADGYDMDYTDSKSIRPRSWVCTGLVNCLCPVPSPTHTHCFYDFACWLFVPLSFLTRFEATLPTRLWNSLHVRINRGCSSRRRNPPAQPAQISFIAPVPYVTCPHAFTLIYALKTKLAGQLWLQLTSAPSNQSAAIKQHPIKFAWQPDAFHHSGKPDVLRAAHLPRALSRRWSGIAN